MQRRIFVISGARRAPCGAWPFAIVPDTSLGRRSKARPAGQSVCYVEPDSSGFVDQRSKELQDSLKDLQQALAKKKTWIEWVDSREAADIVVQVLERRIDPTGRVEGTATATTDKSGRSTTGIASSREIMMYVVQATMTVGDYTNDLTGRIQDTYLLGGLWRTAAGDVADQLEKWVKTNYAKLMADKARPGV